MSRARHDAPRPPPACMHSILDLLELLALDAYIMIAALPMYAWGLHRAARARGARR